MSTDRTLRISEIFESFQGEGPSAGAPSVFLRLAVCNLRCGWCDTKYTWDWETYRYEDEVSTETVEAVAERIGTDTTRHLVVTGGEPLLQDPALARLFSLLPDALHVEVETNGTLSPSDALRRRVTQWNVSPKLANSGEPRNRRVKADALSALRDTGRAWLKLVVANEADVSEAEALAEISGFPRDRVLLMPEAATREALEAREPLVKLWAKTRGYGASPRLHVAKWGGRRGV
ncbi:MAG TPA: 7-carboxy-7-deazaguanine synthase QueE [Polyangiaceae bacterium]|nr:7-carboxy-7-deazaguanine synthase QueE [Polyangiaceae bacterium]